MSAPVVYRSTDASAPTLSGTAGDLITVLNAVLVGTAGIAYGSTPSAGWTAPFTGTNGAVYRPAAGNRFFLLVNDNGPGVGTGQEARIFPSEGCTAYSATAASSTNLFPTAAQAANGLFVRKSATLNATTRNWIIVADDRTLYMFVQTGDVAGTYLAWGFGDFYSLLSGDGFRTFVTARATENSATATVDKLDVITVSTIASRTASYFARGYTGTGGSVALGATAGSEWTASNLFLSGNMAYPNPTDGGVYASRISITDSVTSPNQHRRGWFRGLYHFVHANATVIDGDTFTATSGDFSGKSFVIVKTSGNGGMYLVETSNTWDTSS